VKDRKGPNWGGVVFGVAEDLLRMTVGGERKGKVESPQMEKRLGGQRPTGR